MRSTIPIVMVVLAIGGTVSMWLVDVSNYAILRDETYVTNYFFSVPSNMLFHSALYTGVGIIWALTFFNWKK